MRKIYGVILIILLLILAVTGCSSKDKKTIKADKASEGGASIGRYVEEEMEYPMWIAPNEFVSIAASPNGDIELYAYNEGSYEKYLYTDEKWNKKEAEALQKSNDLNPENFTIRKIFYGEDKKQYLLGETVSDYHSELYRLSDTGVFERVEIKRFEDTYEEWQNVPYVPEVIKVLENGMIAAVYPWGVIEVYSQDGQSVIGEYNCGTSCVLAAEGNTIYYADQNDQELLSINMETKKEGDSRSIEINAFETGIVELVNGSAYLCDSSGLHLNVEGASLWETLLDGGQSSLSMPSEKIKDFVIGTENEYFIVLSNLYNYKVSIKRIIYDDNISSAPPLELSIFSIEDSPLIRQAINIFKESHPEVNIKFRVANTDDLARYTYGIENPKQTITLKDQINALNTELLAGKGADILVLDDLPIESYIDRGILEDMGSVFNPMKASGELLPNITDPYFMDDKVYTMPIRFKLPVIYGVSDAVNAANSITELAEYACNNKEIPLFIPSDYRALAAWFFMTYYDQILGQDNEIDETALKEFLETINIISEAIHASDEAEMNAMGSSNGAAMWDILGSENVYLEECQANMKELGTMMEFGLPLTAVQKGQGAIGTVNNMYKAYGQIGINSAGKQKELAKEFVQLLFSMEIQRWYRYDGFPVNKAAMEEWVQLDVEDFYCIPIGELVITIYYPELEARKKIYECICDADKSMVDDKTMMDMILDEAERYLRGEITAEQAASNAVASINLYLSE